MNNTTIFETMVSDIAPKILKKNRNVMLATIDYLIEKYIIENIKNTVLFDRIDELKESQLDIIQKELSVDFYNFDMTLEEKRYMCKESLAIHMTKGTPEAIKKILKGFYSNAILLEWFEYSGVPGHFKVEVEGVAKDNLEELNNKVNIVKKKSQVLDKITFKTNSNLVMSSKTGSMIGIKQKIREVPIRISFKDSKLKMNTGYREQREEKWN